MAARKRKYVTLKIYKCAECPHLKKGPTYSLDGWDVGRDWTCEKCGKMVAGFVERVTQEPTEIPDWCPLRSGPDAERLIEALTSVVCTPEEKAHRTEVARRRRREMMRPKGNRLR
jgi:hypothetical protein